jgi:hypothetical protein
MRTLFGSKERVNELLKILAMMKRRRQLFRSASGPLASHLLDQCNRDIRQRQRSLVLNVFGRT